MMNTLDTTLNNLRPRPSSSLLGVSPHWSSHVTSTVLLPFVGTDAWGPRMWRLIDNEMTLKECSIYCYSPEEDPYDGEEGEIWSFNYFFFNKTRKRVCYIYLRALSIMSHSSAQQTPVRTKREADGDWSLNESSSSKRARYWLGDRAADISSEWDEDEDEDMIEPWENEGVNSIQSLGEANDPRYESLSKGDNSPTSDVLPMDISSSRSRSKSIMRGMSEGVTDPMVP